VVHRRSGEEVTVEFAATFDGTSEFECQVEGERLGLGDLDDRAARPLRIAAIARLAARPPTVANCTAALTLAAELGPLATSERQTLQALFARMLLGLLEKNAPALDGEVVEIAEALIERAELTTHAELAHLAED